jgi:hypothetical protein
MTGGWRKLHNEELPNLYSSTNVINTTVVFLDIIHCLVLFKRPSCFYLKHNVSETGFCLRLQVKPIQLTIR